MTEDESFLSYCELHCRTERGLFVGRHVNRLLDLAGSPPEYRYMPPSQWLSLDAETCDDLVAKAREQLIQKKVDAVTAEFLK